MTDLCRHCGQPLPPPEAPPEGPHPGITWDRAKRRWRVKLTRAGKTHHVGRFRSFSDAAAALREAEASLPPPLPKVPPQRASTPAPTRPSKVSLTDLLAHFSKGP